jgi:hypothetical protein
MAELRGLVGTWGWLAQSTCIGLVGARGQRGARGVGNVRMRSVARGADWTSQLVGSGHLG